MGFGDGIALAGGPDVVRSFADADGVQAHGVQVAAVHAATSAPNIARGSPSAMGWGSCEGVKG